MTCLLCKGEMKPGTTIHTVQLKNCVVIIKNVPCLKCEQCGEAVLSADTVARIEHILQTVEKAVAEITVVNFPDCAAYEMIEACIIAADYEDDLNEYYREVVRRYYTLGSHPVRNKQWNRLKLLRYICVDNRIVYEDVTPQIR